MIRSPLKREISPTISTFLINSFRFRCQYTASSSPSDNIASRFYQLGAASANIGDSFVLSFASTTAQLQAIPRSINVSSSEAWDSVSQQGTGHYTPSDSGFDQSETTSPQSEVPFMTSVTDSSVFSTPTLAFADLFTNTPLEDGLPTEQADSTFLSLFNLYLESHNAMTEIRSGLQQVTISDLKDGRSVMGIIIKISDLGNTMVRNHNSAIPSLPPPTNDLLFSFIAILKGCELAEQISSIILAPTRSPGRSNSADFCTMTPMYPGKPVTPTIDDYSWTTCSLVTDHCELSVEQITALVRLDIHLSHFNNFISLFAHLVPEQGHGLSAAFLATQYQRRLSHLHNHIRLAVDSIIPAWE
ncbi:hypothetical protein MMC18_004193 [Xylographa bjoerkii]|nr:hypothetical protein [Xylographa bjoerkii]